MVEHHLTIPENELEEKFIHAAGPGGQNVNKVATAVQLRFDVKNSPSISDYVKNRLKTIASHLMTDKGELLIEASRHRMQGRNREDARARLAELIAEASKPPPPKRKKTRPTKGSVERRLKAKTGRGNIKKMRGKVQDD
ncbi:MAG: alternative ribosome rescue aminoacyl-tRNA hydrolase ArfB [Salaquimonas sp.]